MEPTTVSLHALRAIAVRHGFRVPTRVPRPWAGATSRVYPLGGAVLKVPHADPAAVDAVRVDALVIDAARAVGVSTPRLLALDDEGDLLPVPFSLHERVRGGTLVRLGGSPVADGAWRAVGRDLARLHDGVSRSGPLAGLRAFAQTPEVDPRPWVVALGESGLLSPPTARWLGELLDTLTSAALAPVPQRFCHGDVNAANVLVAPHAAGFLALIDWLGAGWLDPAWDFASVPLRAVPSLLAGHREIAPMAHDATAEARILWCHLQLALYGIHAGWIPIDERQRRLARLVRRTREFLAEVPLA